MNILLGSDKDYYSLKKHPFFNGINWSSLRDPSAPILAGVPLKSN